MVVEFACVTRGRLTFLVDGHRPRVVFNSGLVLITERNEIDFGVAGICVLGDPVREEERHSQE